MEGSKKVESDLVPLLLKKVEEVVIGWKIWIRQVEIRMGDFYVVNSFYRFSDVAPPKIEGFVLAFFFVIEVGFSICGEVLIQLSS